MAKDSMKFDGGKYEVVFDNGALYALRNGEHWRDLTGDNLIYWMLMECLRMSEEVSKLK